MLYQISISLHYSFVIIRDFVIQEESARGFPNLINLIGIESPGMNFTPRSKRRERSINSQTFIE
jgi:L-2-hydroxyglutarate oxidase LhgO